MKATPDATPKKNDTPKKSNPFKSATDIIAEVSSSDDSSDDSSDNSLSEKAFIRKDAFSEVPETLPLLVNCATGARLLNISSKHMAHLCATEPRLHAVKVSAKCWRIPREALFDFAGIRGLR